MYEVKDNVTSQTTHVKCGVGDDSDTNSNFKLNLFRFQNTATVYIHLAADKNCITKTNTNIRYTEIRSYPGTSLQSINRGQSLSETQNATQTHTKEPLTHCQEATA